MSGFSSGFSYCLIARQFFTAKDLHISVCGQILFFGLFYEICAIPLQNQLLFIGAEHTHSDHSLELVGLIATTLNDSSQKVFKFQLVYSQHWEITFSLKTTMMMKENLEM